MNKERERERERQRERDRERELTVRKLTVIQVKNVKSRKSVVLFVCFFLVRGGGGLESPHKTLFIYERICYHGSKLFDLRVASVRREASTLSQSDLI